MTEHEDLPPELAEVVDGIPAKRRIEVAALLDRLLEAVPVSPGAGDAALRRRLKGAASRLRRRK